MKDNNTLAWMIAIVAILAIFIFGGFGFNMMSGYGMMGSYWTGGYGFMWIFMMIIWILVIIALVLGIMWLMRQLQQPSNRSRRRR